MAFLKKKKILPKGNYINKMDHPNVSYLLKVLM